MHWPGFVGDHCELDATRCASNSCLHGGVCSEGGATFTCDCDGTGYAGARCEVNVNECARPMACSASSSARSDVWSA